MNLAAAHQVAGLGLLALAVVALANERGYGKGAWLSFLVALASVAAGLFLVLDPIVLHSRDFGDESTQRQVPGALLLCVAAIECRGNGALRHRLWGDMLPSCVIVVGVVYLLVHSRHGGVSLQLQLVQHRVLGATIVLAGLVHAADNVHVAKGRWAAMGWLLLLFAVSLQLLLYEERDAAAVAVHAAPANR